jgi:hypothetical protein
MSPKYCVILKYRCTFRVILAYKALVAVGYLCAAGTLTIQSEQMYSALQGHGCVSRLVILPYESHGYRAKESVLHVLYEKERWLEMHCPRRTQTEISDSSTGEVEAAADPEILSAPSNAPAAA